MEEREVTLRRIDDETLEVTPAKIRIDKATLLQEKKNYEHEIVILTGMLAEIDRKLNVLKGIV